MESEEKKEEAIKKLKNLEAHKGNLL